MERLSISDNDFVELCKSGDAQKVEEAIMNGANVNVSENERFGRTVLMWAAYNGHTETTKILLKHGATVNTQDDEGGTAWTRAISNLSHLDEEMPKEIFQLLNSYGARPC